MGSSSRLTMISGVAKAPVLRRIDLAFFGYSMNEHATWLAVTDVALVDARAAGGLRRRRGEVIPPVDAIVVDRLLADPVFAPLPTPVIERLERSAGTVHLPARARVVAEGKHGDRCYLIVDGTIEITLDGRRCSLLLELTRRRHVERSCCPVGRVDSMLTWDEVIRRADTGNAPPPRRVDKTEDEWRAELEPMAFEVTRHAATERAFSNDMCSRFEPGRYACVCCGTPMFDGSVKFESGTGWPSFTEPLGDDAIAYHVDRTYGMVRVETVCNVCDAHLGHVFPDGPAPTGLRYCMNAAALRKLTDDAHD